MTENQAAYAAEIIDRCVFRLRSIGLTDAEIVYLLLNAAKYRKEQMIEGKS